LSQAGHILDWNGVDRGATQKEHGMYLQTDDGGNLHHFWTGENPPRGKRVYSPTSRSIVRVVGPATFDSIGEEWMPTPIMFEIRAAGERLVRQTSR